jgi:hypothetical protein
MRGCLGFLLFVSALIIGTVAAIIIGVRILLGN